MNQVPTYNKWSILSILIGALILLFYAKEHFLFWDTVQFGSAHPNYFFTSNWNSFWLPPVLDSGHPPFFGQYIALCWEVFGKTLKVTHIAMWPIAIGIIWQLWLLGKKIFSPFAGLIALVVFLEPVLLGQFTLVSPDLVVVFAFLLALNSILSKKHSFLIIAVVLLGMISTRGMMLAFALFIWSWFKDSNSTKWTFAFFWKKFWPFIPGGLAGLSFLLLHYYEFGWIGYHVDSSWAASFERVSWSGLLRNMAIVFIHLLDFGHLFMWLILGFSLYKYKNEILLDVQFRQLLLLLFCLAFFLLPSLVIHKYLFNHRYLLPFFIVLDLMAIYTVVRFWKKTKIGIIVTIVLLGLGSFWIYPQSLATSWDGTIMHWGYYSSRNNLMNYIAEAKIPLDSIGTAFPNIKSLSLIDLSEKETATFLKSDLEKQQYIFYSNVMNDFSAIELEQLDQSFKIEQEYHSGLVFCRLYKRK